MLCVPALLDVATVALKVVSRADTAVLEILEEVALSFLLRGHRRFGGLVVLDVVG